MMDYELVIKRIDGDGNCLFRSLSDQLTGKSDDHVKIRNDICDYIELHEDHYSVFVDEDEDECFEAYVDRMRTFGEWGGHVELHAACQCLLINVFVHQVDGPRYILRCDDTSLACRTLHLSYHGDCHYNSVRRRDDPDVGNRPLPIEVSDFQVSFNEDDPAARVRRALPWVSTDNIAFALESCEDSVDEAIDMLMLNPQLAGPASSLTKPSLKKVSKKVMRPRERDFDDVVYQEMRKIEKKSREPRSEQPPPQTSRRVGIFI